MCECGWDQLKSALLSLDLIHSFASTMDEKRESTEPECVPWFFHDFPFQLDDPTAPLPTSTASQGSTASEKSPPPSDDQEQVEDQSNSASTGTEADARSQESGRSGSNEGGVDPLAWGRKQGVHFSTTSYVGTVTPNTNWLAFSPGDNKRLEREYSESRSDESKSVAVGLNRIYCASVSKMSLNPIYWNSLKHSSNIHRATWFYSTTLTPTEPTLEKAVADAFLQVQPWTMEYLTELKSAIDIPEALEKIKIPITYYQNSEVPNKKPIKNSAVVVFAPCCQFTEEEKVANANDKEGVEQPNTADYPIAYIFAPPSYPSQMLPMLSSAPTGSQLITSLLCGKQPSGVWFSLQRHFSWDVWKKLKSLPDRPTDDPEFEPKKVTQLVLVLHGIGQKLSDRVESFNFTYAINAFRGSIAECLNNPGVKQYVEPDTSVMALPVNWRKTLNFDDLKRNKEDSIISEKEEYSLQDITMKSIPAVRNIISDVMLDIPYYMSHYKPLLLEAAAREANRIYRLFLKFNPGFEDYGKVNVIGHSLGSVIAMDLLSSQPTDVFNMTDNEKERRVKFEFNTSNLFLVGSPAAFFLLLENSRLYPRKMYDEKLKGQRESEPPSDDESKTVEGFDSVYGNISGSSLPYGCVAVDNIYNVLHYSDPISYMLNPTVDPELAKTIEPASIPSEKMFPAPGTEGSGFFENLTSRIPFWTESKPGSRKNSVERIEANPKKDDSSNKQHSESSSESSSHLPSSMPSEVELETRNFDKEHHAENKMLLLNDNGQIDWLIPLTGTLENQYFSMLTAHSGYWDNKDFARMVAVECGRKRGKDYSLRQFEARKKC